MHWQKQSQLIKVALQSTVCPGLLKCQQLKPLPGQSWNLAINSALQLSVKQIGSFNQFTSHSDLLSVFACDCVYACVSVRSLNWQNFAAYAHQIYIFNYISNLSAKACASSDIFKIGIAAFQAMKQYQYPLYGKFYNLHLSMLTRSFGVVVAIANCLPTLHMYVCIHYAKIAV